MTNRCIGCLLLITALWVGCGAPSTPATPRPAARGGAFGQVGAAIEENEEQARIAEEQAAAELAAQEAAKAAAEAQRQQPRQVTIDDMRRGKSLRGGGYLATVLSARFRAEHKLTLIQVEHAMNLFNGLHGHYPKSHDEFMEQIIRANSIQLPQLDEGFEYLYDPSDHELKMRPSDADVGNAQEDT